MKLITIFLLSSPFCFGQYKPTRLDTLKAQVAYDSAQTINVMSDFKNIIFKKLDNADQYEFIKKWADEFIAEKKRIWSQYIKNNK